MFHTVVQHGFWKLARIVVFVDNVLLVPTVKEFSKSASIWRSYCKNSTPRFLIRSIFCAHFPKSWRPTRFNSTQLKKKTEKSPSFCQSRSVIVPTETGGLCSKATEHEQHNNIEYLILFCYSSLEWVL